MTCNQTPPPIRATASRARAEQIAAPKGRLTITATPRSFATGERALGFAFHEGRIDLHEIDPLLFQDARDVTTPVRGGMGDAGVTNRPASSIPARLPAASPNRPGYAPE